MIPQLIGHVLVFFDRARNYFVRRYTISQLRKAGESVYMGKGCTLTPSHIEVGDHVYIGDYCCIRSAHGLVSIGSHVMLGPGVHIHGGDHPFRVVGKLIDECEKELGSDGVVSIEDDCWIGSNAIILKGVTIGCGSVVGAGSIVSKDIPAYSIYTGSGGGAVLRPRFTDGDLRAHEEILKDRFGDNEA